MNLEARIIELLVASGNVTEGKVEQARKLALSLKWNDGPPNTGLQADEPKPSRMVSIEDEDGDVIGREAEW